MKFDNYNVSQMVCSGSYVDPFQKATFSNSGSLNNINWVLLGFLKEANALRWIQIKFGILNRNTQASTFPQGIRE